MCISQVYYSNGDGWIISSNLTDSESISLTYSRRIKVRLISERYQEDPMIFEDI